MDGGETDEEKTPNNSETPRYDFLCINPTSAVIQNVARVRGTDLAESS